MAIATDEQKEQITATVPEEKTTPKEKPAPAVAAKPSARPAIKARAADNVVFVGKKPTMSYVLAVITQFNSGINEVKIKARGRSISRAVDVAEVVNNKFMKDLTKNITSSTEEITDENNNRLNVSAIDITLTK